VITQLAFFEEAPGCQETSNRLALVITRAATGPKGVDQSSIPVRRADVPRIGKRRAWFVQEGDDIHRAIDRSHLAANDVWHRLAVERRRHGEVGGFGPVRVEW